MKRRIIMLATIMVFVCLMVGCQSGSESMPTRVVTVVSKAQAFSYPEPLSEAVLLSVLGGSVPDFIDTLTNNSVVSIYGVDTTDGAVTVAFSYTADESTSCDRILRVGHSLKDLVLYDITGSPLSGYIYSGDESASNMAIFSGENYIGFSQPSAPDSSILIEVLYDGLLTQTVFINEDEFDAAMALYEAVHANGVDPGALTPTEQELLSRAESISLWSELSPEQEADIETATQLALDKDFQDYIDADYSPDQPATAMPEWLKKFCDTVRTLKLICTVTNLQVVCQILTVLVIICDALEILLS